VGRVSAGPLAQRLFGVEFQSPVLLASGTCGYGEEYADLIPLDKLGGLVTKAVSLEPRVGNPPHRISETPAGMLNAIGLQNVGLERFVDEKLPWLRRHLSRARVFVNVVGRSVEEYAGVVAGLDGEEGFLGYEINVSCPNVEGGTLFGTDAEALGELVARLRSETERPLLVKLTPNVPEIGRYARVCEAAGADDPALPGCRAEDEDGEPPLLEPFTRRDVDLADIELQSRVFVLLVLIVGMSVFAMAAASYVGIRPEIGAIAGAAAAILSPRRKPK